MTVADFIAQSYLKSTGKVSTLTSTDPDYIKLLQLGNYYQQTFAKEPGVDWDSLYNPTVSCGTVTNTNTFTLDPSIYKVSQEELDPVRIAWSGGSSNYSDYTVISPTKLKYYIHGNYCTQVSTSLIFNRTFVSTDKEFGGTVNVPAYTLPDELVDPTDAIVVDIPEWLSTICAAEYVRTNLVLQNQYPNLLAEANQLMIKMIENNGAQKENVTIKPAALGRTW